MVVYTVQPGVYGTLGLVPVPGVTIIGGIKVEDIGVEDSNDGAVLVSVA